MEIEIFAKDNCSFCDKAFKLAETLVKLDKPLTVIKTYVTSDGEHFNRLKEKCPNAKTVPQIFVDDNYIGGFQEFTKFVEELC